MHPGKYNLLKINIFILMYTKKLKIGRSEGAKELRAYAKACDLGRLSPNPSLVSMLGENPQRAPQAELDKAKKSEPRPGSN